MQESTNVKLPLSTMLLALFIGFAAGNFVFQICANQNWAVASDRSFSQFMALFSVWIARKWINETKIPPQ